MKWTLELPLVNQTSIVSYYRSYFLRVLTLRSELGGQNDGIDVGCIEFKFILRSLVPSSSHPLCLLISPLKPYISECSLLYAHARSCICCFRCSPWIRLPCYMSRLLLMLVYLTEGLGSSTHGRAGESTSELYEPRSMKVSIEEKEKERTS